MIAKANTAVKQPGAADGVERRLEWSLTVQGITKLRCAQVIELQ